MGPLFLLPLVCLVLSPRQAVAVTCHLVDPVLSFVKAYRLKGDVVCFKAGLWDFCCTDLESLGLHYHARLQFSDILTADILLAFEKLKDKEKLPPIYCEANDLIKLPSLQ